MSKTLPPIHPGEILLEEFLKPLDMNPHQLAMALRVPPNRIAQIIQGERGITADTALRLGRYFGSDRRSRRLDEANRHGDLHLARRS